MSDAGRAPDTANWNPVFAQRLAAFREALAKAGIQTKVASGYRTPEYQNQMYQNHLAKQAHQPLPYPNVEAPGVVAPAWRSFHNYGIAADVTPANPDDYPRMWALANQFGLTALGKNDMSHFQLSGTLDENIKRYNLAGWRPEARPAPAEGAIAYTGGPPPGQPPASLVARGTTVSPYGNPFLDSLASIESSNRNIPSEIDKDYPGQPGSKSQGFFQIDTPTWLQFAAKAGIDTTKFPNAMSAPSEVQAQVASLIPLSRFGKITQEKLGQRYGSLDASKTVGELAAQTPGTTLNTVPQGVVDPSIVARGGTSPTIPTDGTTVAVAPAAPSFGEALRSGDVGGAIKAAITKTPRKDAQGNEIEGKSPLERLAGSFAQGKEGGAPVIPEMHMATAPAMDPMANLAPAAQQLFTTVSAAAAKPLSWSSAPYGTGAGYVPGTTLNQSNPYG